MLSDGKDEPVFSGLKDPFYSVDSRDYQVIQPNHKVIEEMGAKILCIEKNRPHVPYERAIMGIRFNEYMIGTQFHPEADAVGMSMYLQTEEKKKTVIEEHGEEKWVSMLKHLNDPDKIMWTYSHVLPNFLNQSIEQLIPELVWGCLSTAVILFIVPCVALLCNINSIQLFISHRWYEFTQKLIREHLCNLWDHIIDYCRRTFASLYLTSIYKT